MAAEAPSARARTATLSSPKPAVVAACPALVWPHSEISARLVPAVTVARVSVDHAGATCWIAPETFGGGRATAVDRLFTRGCTRRFCSFRGRKDTQGREPQHGSERCTTLHKRSAGEPASLINRPPAGLDFATFFRCEVRNLIKLQAHKATVLSLRRSTNRLVAFREPTGSAATTMPSEFTPTANGVTGIPKR
jgi:hypothetical protein